MNDILCAFCIHCISRVEESDSHNHFESPNKPNLLDLIAKIFRECGGSIDSGSGENVIYRFPEVDLAVNAAINVQRELDFINAKNHLNPINLVSIGIVSKVNPFTGLREDERSVKLAVFMAQSAGAGELYLSEGAYNSLKDPSSILCRFARQLLRTGEEYALNVYEVFWTPTEIDLGRLKGDPSAIDLDIQPIRSFGLKLIAGILLLFVCVLLLTLGYEALWSWLMQMVYR